MNGKNDDTETARLDRWLWIARFAKTRTKAADLCRGNKIKVNRIPGKPSKEVRVGDELSVNWDGDYRRYEITGIAHRPIPAKEARELYRETTPPKKKKEADELMQIARRMEREAPQSKGRPTKKDRRQMEKVRGLK